VGEKLLYLIKSNDDVISHCRCKHAPISSPDQMDCPWCGCGWLFVCSHCGKAFTFAKAVEIDESLEEIARGELRRRWKREPGLEEVADWVRAMVDFLNGIEVGQEYVYLDGAVLPVDSEAITLTGWSARHELPRLPQVEARMSRKLLDNTLVRETYWRQRQLPTE